MFLSVAFLTTIAVLPEAYQHALMCLPFGLIFFHLALWGIKHSKKRSQKTERGWSIILLVLSLFLLLLFVVAVIQGSLWLEALWVVLATIVGFLPFLFIIRAVKNRKKKKKK